MTRYRNHRGCRLLAAATFAASLGLLTAHEGWAEHCSSRTTEGRYAVVGDGYISPAPGAPLLPAKLLSLAIADANGTFSATGTIDVGGQFLTQTVVGTEQLNPDCTGLIVYKQTLGGQPAPDLRLTFIVSEHGDRIDGLSLDAGSVFSAVLRRLDR